MYFMMATALSVMSATLVLKLHYQGFTKEPPDWLRFIVFDMMATCLCLRSLTKWDQCHRHCIKHDIAMKTFKTANAQSNCRQDKNVKGPTSRKRTVTFQSQMLAVKGHNYGTTNSTNAKVVVTENGSTTVCNLPTKKHILIEWQKMSEVLDRFFFWIFLIFILIPLVSLAGFVRVFKPM